MIYHIVTGDIAAKPLKEAISIQLSMAGEVVVIKDVLNLGTINSNVDESFSEMRSAFWNSILLNEQNIDKVFVCDREKLLNVIEDVKKTPDSKIWLWIAPLPADVCTYLWCLKYISNIIDRFFILKIAGLPFLDADKKLYFPKSIGDILPAELVKAKQLARLLTITEFETDIEEWEKLTLENAVIRVLESGKKIVSKNESYYDSVLIDICTVQYQKANKIVWHAITKFKVPTGDFFLKWRLAKLVESGKLITSTENGVHTKDFEVKLPGDELQLELGI